MEKIESATSTVFIYKEDDIVIKIINKTYTPISCYELFLNEVNWLNQFRRFSMLPNLLDFNKEGLSIITNYYGERLTKENSPDDIEEQIDLIISALKKCRCKHNDIKPNDLLVKDGKLTLIDFGWANEYDKPVHSHWPPLLGEKFKSESDRGSFDKILTWLYK